MFNKKFENALIEFAKRKALGDYLLLEKSIPFVEDMSESILAKYNQNSDRDTVVSYLEQKLAEEENYLGTWVGFESGVFDYKDEENLDKSHSDKNGRFVPYCYRDESGEIKVMPLENIDEENFYYLTKENNSLTLLDPFTYEIEGEEVLMTCVAKPIQSQGEIIAVTGVDIQLKTAKNIYQDLIYHETGLEDTTDESLLDIIQGAKSKEKNVLSQAVQALVSNQNEILSDLQKSSDRLIENSESLHKSSTETKKASEELAKTTETLADKVSLQSEYTNETSSNMNKLNEFIGQNDQILSKLDVVISEVKQAKRDGNESVNSLQTKTGDIQEIVDQIKMLSLNASVEAARAGEEGQSFAVVAVEIRKLSHKSYQVLESIQEVVTDIEEKFSSIAEAINETNTAVNKVSEIGKSISEIEKKVLDNISKLSELAQENAAGIEQASSVAEELSNTSEELEKISGELHSTVNSFKETLNKLSVEDKK